MRLKALAAIRVQKRQNACLGNYTYYYSTNIMFRSIKYLRGSKFLRMEPKQSASWADELDHRGAELLDLDLEERGLVLPLRRRLLGDAELRVDVRVRRDAPYRLCEAIHTSNSFMLGWA